MPGTGRKTRQELPGGEGVSKAKREACRAREAKETVRKWAYPAAKRPRGSLAMADALRPLWFEQKQEIIGPRENPESPIHDLIHSDLLTPSLFLPQPRIHGIRPIHFSLSLVSHLAQTWHSLCARTFCQRRALWTQSLSNPRQVSWGFVLNEQWTKAGSFSRTIQDL